MLLFAVSTCYAGNGFSAPCSENWMRYDKKLDPHVFSDLSECQAKTLGDLSTNNILLGGKGTFQLNCPVRGKHEISVYLFSQEVVLSLGYLLMGRTKVAGIQQSA